MIKGQDVMDLDELKQKWAEQDRKLDAILRMNRQLLTASNLNRARSGLQRLAIALGVESVIWFAIIGALGHFIYEHAALVRFAIPAVCLDVYAIANLIALIRQMKAALDLDYSKPIAVIQKQIESLRILRIRYTQVAVIAGVLAWTPFVIVALKGFLELDAYLVPGVPWLLANVLSTIAFAALAVMLSRKYGEQMGRSPFLQRLMKDVAGYNLNAAAESLVKLSEFEHETCAE
jgi:hypothetical protein